MARAKVVGFKKLDGLPRKSNDCDQIVLVDADDVPQGVAPKIEVHRRGLKHRALSVLVRDSSGNMLVHRRNAAKYHSGGLWTNACCSHPRPDEPPAAAAHRRLAEEMGVRCEVKPLFTALAEDLTRRPQLYTIWLRHYFREHYGAIAAWMETG